MTHSVKRVKDRDSSSGRRTRLVVSELKTPGEVGTPMDPDNFSHPFARLCKGAGQMRGCGGG